MDLVLDLVLVLVLCMRIIKQILITIIFIVHHLVTLLHFTSLLRRTAPPWLKRLVTVSVWVVKCGIALTVSRVESADEKQVRRINASCSGVRSVMTGEVVHLKNKMADTERAGREDEEERVHSRSGTRSHEEGPSSNQRASRLDVRPLTRVRVLLVPPGQTDEDGGEEEEEEEGAGVKASGRHGDSAGSAGVELLLSDVYDSSFSGLRSGRSVSQTSVYLVLQRRMLGVRLALTGHFRCPSPCEEERRAAASGVFVPSCDDGGRFSSRQCQQGGQCWCVDPTGRERPGTRQLGDALVCSSGLDDCLSQRRRALSRLFSGPVAPPLLGNSSGKSPASSCLSLLRPLRDVLPVEADPTSFLSRLVEVLQGLFPSVGGAVRALSGASSRRLQENLFGGKFLKNAAALNLSGAVGARGALGLERLSSLSLMKNRDLVRYVSRALEDDAFLSALRRTLTGLSSSLSLEQVLTPLLRSCSAHEDHDGAAIFVPSCKSDGGFREVQCQGGGACWCVDPQGREVAGSRSSGRRPRCPSRCERERAAALEVKGNMAAGAEIHIPACSEDGDFLPLQCVGSRCFCVNAEGRPMTAGPTGGAVTCHCARALAEVTAFTEQAKGIVALSGSSHLPLGYGFLLADGLRLTADELQVRRSQEELQISETLLSRSNAALQLAAYSSPLCPDPVVTHGALLCRPAADGRQSCDLLPVSGHSVMLCDESSVRLQCDGDESMTLTVTWTAALSDLPTSDLPDLHDIGLFLNESRLLDGVQGLLGNISSTLVSVTTPSFGCSRGYHLAGDGEGCGVTECQRQGLRCSERGDFLSGQPDFLSGRWRCVSSEGAKLEWTDSDKALTDEECSGAEFPLQQQRGRSLVRMRMTKAVSGVFRTQVFSGHTSLSDAHRFCQDGCDHDTCCDGFILNQNRLHGADSALPADSKKKKDYQASIVSFQAVYLNTGSVQRRFESLSEDDVLVDPQRNLSVLSFWLNKKNYDSQQALLWCLTRCVAERRCSVADLRDADSTGFFSCSLFPDTRVCGAYDKPLRRACRLLLDRSPNNTYSRTASQKPGLLDGSTLAAVGNIVVVTAHYRTAALGFLSTGESGLPGNYGLSDQEAVLRWVNAHISLMGGDNSRVTVGAERGGADMTSLHLLVSSSLSPPLFQRMMLMGGSVFSPSLLHSSSSSSSRQQTLDLAKELGCVTSDLVACLRTTPVDKLNAAQTKLLAVSGPFRSWSPVLRRSDSPLSLRGVDLLLGSLEQDGLIVRARRVKDFEALQGRADGKTAFYEALRRSLGGEAGSELLKEAASWFYSLDHGPSPAGYNLFSRALDNATRDLFITCPGLRMASHWANGGANVFLYHQPASAADHRADASVPLDVQFVFGTPHHPISSQRFPTSGRRLSLAMMTYVSSFVRTGNPNPSRVWEESVLPRWQPVQSSEATPTYLEISPALRHRQGLRQKPCSFWSQMGTRLSQGTAKVTTTTTSRPVYSTRDFTTHSLLWCCCRGRHRGFSPYSHIDDVPLYTTHSRFQGTNGPYEEMEKPSANRTGMYTVNQ
ncbi:hypothetical protein F2P81_016545 [Scophthalmus maximus]|uniref:Thyroglobulin type-1 domain-containing protein n=1 Tax=Scophthalmus maximus TaxID=52904 RepID=A0A6A4SJC9_SCOMX|nr:hypothetical protein F2P81_016545 [Scophthalmus maximus]